MKVLKSAWIGFLTTLRAGLQFLIPEGSQTVLEPSVFAEKGSMLLVFMIYGTIAYGSIAAIFLLFQKSMSGSRIKKGLKFGLLYSLLWTVYLLEPLPHTALMDKITYPLADSAALLGMGLLLGRFVAVSSPVTKYELTRQSQANVGWVAGLFFIGRLIQYMTFHIYSSFRQSPISSLIWAMGTGIAIGLVFDYINPLLDDKGVVRKSVIYGGLVFGVNMFAFNFFMPLVFRVDMLDLFIRTIVDMVFVGLGAYLANRYIKNPC